MIVYNSICCFSQQSLHGLRLNVIDLAAGPAAKAYPKQPDEWSCGHRVILYVQALLGHGLALEAGSDWMVPMLELNVSEDDLSVQKMEEICQNSTAAFAKQPVKLEQKVAKPFSASAPSASSASTASSARPVATPARQTQTCPPTKQERKEPQSEVVEPVGVASAPAAPMVLTR